MWDADLLVNTSNPLLATKVGDAPILPGRTSAPGTGLFDYSLMEVTYTWVESLGQFRVVGVPIQHFELGTPTGAQTNAFDILVDDPFTDRSAVYAGLHSSAVGLSGDIPGWSGIYDNFEILYTVPEPSAAILLGLGALGFLVRRKR